MSPEDERYFDRIEADLDDAFERARAARECGYDPATEIEIPVAADMADRVENILGIPGVAERVRELEADHSREEAALALVTDFVEGTVGDYDGRAGKIEGAVRTAVALLTEGVVAAPIEGIDRVELLDNDDGTEFVNVYYAGPIRSAGGTAQALSVLVADYARSLLGIEGFHPREAEVERYAEEVALYDQETGLQYSPTDPETKFIAEHMPIMLDGEATGDEEVSGYRDLERVDTNNARGGMCLVLGEGIALKAPKIQRYTGDLDEVDWPWLQDLIDGNYHEDDGTESTPSDGPAGADGESATGDGNGDAAPGDDSTEADGSTKADDSAETDGDGSTDGDAAPPRPDSSKKFLRDLIAGRPVFGHPSEPGGFRLRYGRARNHGFATGGIHPATMHVVDDFLAAGTQIKTERPGKAHGIVPVDTIEGPTVRLANGEVRRIDDAETAESLRNGVEEIIDLGEYLVNYGEFVENNHPLAPASYAPEWWVQEFAAAGADVQALRDDPHVDLDAPASEAALRWAREYDCPLHPEYTYLWHDVSVDDLDDLAAAAADGRLVDAESDGTGPSEQREERAVGDGGVAASGTDAREGRELVVDRTEAIGRTLERLLVEHRQTDEHCRIPEPRPLLVQLGIDDDGTRTWSLADLSERARGYGDPDGSNAVAAVNEVAPVRVRERAPVRIGNRMGRPEKSEDRELSPAVHTLFPLNEAGGNQRSVPEAARTRTDIGRGVLDVEVGDRSCPDCGAHTYRPDCPECGGHTEPYYECDDCGIETSPDEAGRVECPRCERRVTSPVTRSVDLGERYQEAMDRVGEREAAFDALKGVKGLSSAHKTPEPIEKGILRAKHGVSAFKDGTVRYDMTDLPVTAVRPGELDVPPDDLRELGYETDIDGEPLRHDDQLVELKVQDLILPDGAAEHMLQTADFVDDLLTEFYGLDPFYGVEDRQDLVGELVFGMAPHTSAAVVGRVVGFTTASAGYAHPYFHAAKRRNCDGDEDCVMLLMDGLLNFSKEYLPDQRGGQMDAPLVMSSRIDPAEIDDEAHNVDVVSEYPREFYEATRELADPEAVEDLIEIAEDSLGETDEYRGFEHTHDTADLALGPDLSAYKTLGSMDEKTDDQLALARQLRAVDETDVAERIIEYHFLPDLIGNLRAFARQETRCRDCGTSFRRAPLTGDCPDCGGEVGLTVYRGSVNKYMETATTVAEEFGCRDYTKQRLEVLERSLESIFENDKNKQSGIADFM